MDRRTVTMCMTTGYFDHIQYQLRSMADALKDKAEGQYQDDLETKTRLIRIHEMMNLTAAMMQRVDYLIGGDETRDSFIERVKGELGNQHSNKKEEELMAKLTLAISLLKCAECTGETYRNITERSKWKLERDSLISEF